MRGLEWEIHVCIRASNPWADPIATVKLSEGKIKTGVGDGSLVRQETVYRCYNLPCGWSSQLNVTSNAEKSCKDVLLVMKRKTRRMQTVLVIVMVSFAWRASLHPRGGGGYSGARIGEVVMGVKKRER